MLELKQQLNLWKLHLTILIVGIISEFIGIQKFDVFGFTQILLLPFLFAFLFTTILNPNIFSKSKKIISQKEFKAASPFIIIALMPFIAKFGTTIGPAIDIIIQTGPALILQEIGNLGTILIAFPLAIWIFKLNRESIGATFSIAREPNIAVIADKYGLNTPEGSGVMSVYVIGTLFGTIIFSVIPSIFIHLNIFHWESLSMACGVGSSSMMAACTSTVAAAFPDSKEQILALAGASNLLTYATGLYVSIFIALPLIEKLYKMMKREENSCQGSTK